MKGLPLLAGLLFCICTCLPAAAQVPVPVPVPPVVRPFQPGTERQTSDRPPMQTRPVQMPSGTKLAQALALVRDLYVDADSLDIQEIEENALRETMQQLDPHSSYQTRDEARLTNDNMRGRFEGVGISTVIYRDTAMVVGVTPNGPAERAGVQVGDRIVTIDMKPFVGKDVTRNSLQQVLRGERGTRVLLGIRRKNVPRLLSMYIVRGSIPIESVEVACMVTPTTGYIKLSRFSGTTYEEFVKAVGRLRWNGMQRLLLDVCDNSGGLLDAAVRVTDLFLQNGQLILYTEGDRMRRTEYRATPADLLMQTPLAVMVNEGSASCSEILAGAIQDWERGTIVGRRTFGKGLVQRQISFLDGSMLRLTVARYHTPSGRVIQKPFMESREAYAREILTRDPAAAPATDTSMLFHTMLTQRPVYGGGGIMPDVTVLPDSLQRHERRLRNDQVQAATACLVDTYVSAWRRQYPTLELFVERFALSPEALGVVRDELRRQQLLPDEEVLYSGASVRQLTLSMARILWGEEAYYRIYNKTNPIFTQALEVLESLPAQE